MRYSARWMTICDERILERLSEVETDTPKGMADRGDVRFSQQYIGERCRKLTNYKLDKDRLWDLFQETHYYQKMRNLFVETAYKEGKVYVKQSS